jgi:hypothetical protein
LNKETITREFFIEIMNDIEKTYRYQEGLNDYFAKNGADGYVYQPDCIDTTIKILHKFFEEKDIDEWISYFCFELDFGRKYKDGAIKDEFGKNITLATSDDLYNILTE